MFDFPGESELNRLYRSRRAERLDELTAPECLVAGGDPAALVAAIFLERENIKTTLVVETETPGGRFTRPQGLAPVFAPAVQLLEELDFRLESPPPAWVHRIRLVSYLTELYFAAGGNLLNGVTVENIWNTDENFEVKLLSDREPLVLKSGDGIVTGTLLEPEKLVEPELNLAEFMVLNTGRNSRGLVQAGYQVLPDYSRGQEMKLVSGMLLSGRKAAELVLSAAGN